MTDKEMFEKIYTIATTEGTADTDMADWAKKKLASLENRRKYAAEHRKPSKAHIQNEKEADILAAYLNDKPRTAGEIGASTPGFEEASAVHMAHLLKILVAQGRAQMQKVGKANRYTVPGAMGPQDSAKAQAEAATDPTNESAEGDSDLPNLEEAA